MLVRNILLTLGVLSLIGGLLLAVVWLRQIDTPAPSQPVVAQNAILAASRTITSGTLLRPEDVIWKDIPASDIQTGFIVRRPGAEADFMGAIVRRDFAADEPFVVTDLLRPSERQFLAAALRPGTRAVSIAVDAPQSAAGLIQPGDQVDVILAQSFAEGTADANRRSVAETVLRDVRVIAIDQTLSTPARSAGAPARPPATAGPDSRLPRTVTFEVTEKQAERLIVAAQLGRLQLSVRPLQVAPASADTMSHDTGPTWAAEVSPALNELARRKPQAESGVESAVRRPPARGDSP